MERTVTEHLGIKETEELIKFLAKVASGLVNTIASGGSLFSILGLVTASAGDLGDAMEGIRKVPDEIKNLSRTERIALSQAFARSFNIPYENGERMIEAAIPLILHAIDFGLETANLKTV